MNHSLLKKIVILAIFIVGIGMCAGGIGLVVQNWDAVRYFLIDLPARNSPQAKISDFVKSITKGDSKTALKLWEIPSTLSPDKRSALETRQRLVVSDLISTKLNPEYMILGIEWWTTCCEPNVTNDSRNAGGARVKVQFLDKNGLPVLYTFDVFTREQPYWGEALGYPPRDWVIRDVYPDGKKPIFWPLIIESQIKFIQTAEP